MSAGCACKLGQRPRKSAGGLEGAVNPPMEKNFGF